MKTVLNRATIGIAALSIVSGTLVTCLVAGLGEPATHLTLLSTILWLLGGGGVICLLLGRLIQADDRVRELACAAQRAADGRRQAEELLAETQKVLSKLLRQQESAREGERGRIASDIQEELGQTLVSLRVELSLLQVSSNGIHPIVHGKATAMIGTLDLALRSLRVLVNGLGPLVGGEDLRTAMTRQLSEFTRLTGIAHRFDAGAGAFEAVCRQAQGTDAMLYRALQETLGEVAHGNGASEVQVALLRDGDHLLLRIEDNGGGTAAMGARCACAIGGMRSRVEAAGGKLRFSHAPGAGLRFSLSLPMAHGLVPG